MSESPHRDINELGKAIRTRSISDSHKAYPEPMGVALEIQNELGTVGVAADMKWLFGNEQDVQQLQEEVEKWIRDVSGTEEELNKRDFGKEKREALFAKVGQKIRERPNI